MTADASIEIEHAFLGGLLQDPAAVDAVRLLQMHPRHFIDARHGEIFAAILAVASQGAGADPVTVFEHLTRTGQAARCGGLPYLLQLEQCVQSARNVSRHAQMLRDKCAKRDALELLDKARSDLNASTDLNESLAHTREALGGLITQPNNGAPTDPLGMLAGFFVTDEGVQEMEDTRVLHQVIGQQHLAVWAGAAGNGKTTIARHVAGNLAADGYTVMYFQEDASAGDLPELFRHSKDHGYKLLNSTLSNKSPDDMLQSLHQLVVGAADLRRHVYFFDTLKKFADLMSKWGTREFFRLMRGLTLRGCTVILNGHTNKHKGMDGKLVFEGVGDVRNDVDELIYIEATDKDAHGMVTMTMRPDKVRCMVRELSFSYDTHTRELRALPAAVDVGAVLARQRQLKDDEAGIETVRQALRGGGMNFTELVQAVAESAGMSRNAARTLINRYASERLDDADALWMDTRLGSDNARRISLRPVGKGLQ